MINHNMHYICDFNGVGSTTNMQKLNKYAGGLYCHMFLVRHFAPISYLIKKDSYKFSLLLVLVNMRLHQNT